MLKRLIISNFAIIDNVELEFDNQLTVITGETGSGKSILLGAINLLLGERADYSVIRDNSGKTIVEGLWTINPDLESFFKENDLDFDLECVIRREVLKEGKSRAFINDTPVNLTVLKELTRRLIHIHSQHDTIELRDKAFQLGVVDTLGGNENLLKTYQEKFKELKAATQERDECRETLSQVIKDKDYNNFQIEELEKLKLRTTNYDELKSKLEEMEHAELILENTSNSINLLDNSEGILTQINRLKQLLSKTSLYAKNLELLEERVSSCEIELRDLLAELENFNESISHNPNEINHLNDIIDNFNRALKKHNAETQSDLITIYSAFVSKNASTEDLESRLEKLEKLVSKKRNELNEIGAKLSEERKKAASEISEKLKPYFERLKLNNARIRFEITEKSTPDINGFNSTDLYFSTNSGIAPQQIEKVASGGELSRLMLIIMTLLSERKSLPTVIFDEIDTGVSGDVADRIGQLLREMGSNRQLLTITHLPQVAAAGHHQMSVRKTNVGSSTISEVVKLNKEERIKEIAKLLSGEEVTNAALENAKQLYSQHD